MDHDPRPGSPPSHTWWRELTPRHAVHALRHLWASDVNDAAIELLDPAPEHVVVDIGAGLGPATVGIARRSRRPGRVIAVDPSRLMRAAVRTRRLWQAERKLIEVRAGTVEALPVESSSVDAALALNAMHHFSDLTRAAAELARILRPGGRLLLVDEDFDDAGHSFADSADHHHGPDMVDPERVVAVLTQAGLRNVSAQRRVLGSEPAIVIRATG